MTNEVTPKSLLAAGDIGSRIMEWNMSFGDTAGSVKMDQFTEASVQVDGDFGETGVATLEGSNNGVDFHVLKDPQGNDLRFTQSGLRSVGQVCNALRASVPDGDENTRLVITLLMKQ